MKKILILSIAGVIAASAPAETWTLDQCIDYAHTHNLTVRARVLDSESARQSVTEAKDAFLPTLRGSANQGWDFGRGLTAENTYANRNTSNFGASVALSLPLFQGLQGVRRLQYAKANLAAVLEQEDAARDDVTLNVISLYLQALLSREVCHIQQQQVDLSEFELQRRRQLLDAGKIAQLEVTQAESQLAQDNLSLVDARNSYSLALLDLAQALELPGTDGFDIAEISASEYAVPDMGSIYSRALTSNHSLLASERALEAAHRNVSLAKTGYIPTLSFNAGLGSSYYTVAGTVNPSFGTQMRENFSKSVGFSLSVPLFDAFGTRNSVRRARIQVLSAQLQVESSRVQLYKAIANASTQADGARHKHTASLEAERAAREAFEAVQTKYDYGRATSTEYQQAKTNYSIAQFQSAQAKYEQILRQRILAFYNK